MTKTGNISGIQNVSLTYHWSDIVNVSRIKLLYSMWRSEKDFTRLGYKKESELETLLITN